jgi:hypothetical protein|tara:strand:- start:707 stop:928 length:222 start_codon:yes stop_codon:yes gene_type:complete
VKLQFLIEAFIKLVLMNDEFSKEELSRIAFVKLQLTNEQFKYVEFDKSVLEKSVLEMIVFLTYLDICASLLIE